MARAMDVARIAAAGPSTMAAIETPMAWLVVPPGSGRLNIITMKQNAAKTEMRGISRALRVRLTLRSDVYQPTPAPVYMTAQVEGLRYPSGMCIVRATGSEGDCK